MAQTTFGILTEEDFLDFNLIGVMHNEFLDHNITSFDDSNISVDNKEIFLESFYSEIATNSEGLVLGGNALTSQKVLANTPFDLISEYIFPEITSVNQRFNNSLNNLLTTENISDDEYVLLTDFWRDLTTGNVDYEHYKLEWSAVEKSKSLGIVSGSVISIGANSLDFWNGYFQREIQLKGAPFIIAAADTAGAVEAAAAWAISNSITGWDDPAIEVFDGFVSLAVGAGISSAAGWFKAVRWLKRAWDWF